MIDKNSTLICTGCSKEPKDILTCIEMAKAYECTPNEFVFNEEGTLNKQNGHFLCDECYINAGCPSSPNGWIAP